MGVCSIDQEGNLDLGVHTNLPGEVQTMPRSVIHALFLLLKLAYPLAEIKYVTNNEGLYNVYIQGPTYSQTTNNCDLHKQIYQIACEKAITFSVRWMPSHLLEKPTKGVFSCCTNMDILGRRAVK